ncbi:MAG: KpsF/GutQ family sugar-phosphate isomerase [Pseudomonadota bacterium]
MASLTSKTAETIDPILQTGARVLKTEADALFKLTESLDASFTAAVNTIMALKGRVIVSGMGKSGHIARKIAATLASTGTPSTFVHPGEASHGDLGMIAPDDLVLLLSNSGETPELADLIAFAQGRAIPIIGVAGRKGSTLLRKADISLVLPEAPEACPNGLAPTTSTTMTLALGDALAVALMTERGFTPENYRSFHPGGRLGAMLSTVGDLMHRGEDLPLITLDLPMGEALLVMTSKGFGVAGVVDTEGVLQGVITDGDLRRNMPGLTERKAHVVMTPNPRTISATALASEALRVMNAGKPRTTSLFVVDDAGRPDGILHVHDCLRAGIA